MRVAVVGLWALARQLAHAAPPGVCDDPRLSPPGLVPEVTPPPASADTGVTPYHDQTLATDGIAAGLLVLAFDQDNGQTSPALAKLGIATYLFGAPLVHLSRNRTGGAIGSFAMRLALPAAGALLGAAAERPTTCDSDDCAHDAVPSEMALGVIAGIVAASAIDALYLARDGERKRAPTRKWTPTARAMQGGLALGVGGAF